MRHLPMSPLASAARSTICRLSLPAPSIPECPLSGIFHILAIPFLSGARNYSLIHQRFQGGLATALSQVQAMSGLGGIGKTQIAVEYAYRYRQDYQAVLWARADTREELTSLYVMLASLLRLAAQDEQDQQRVLQAVRRWLETHDRWLLILDNADELHFLPAFLLPSPIGHLLLTTRAAALCRLAYRLDVGTFSLEQSALRRAALIAPDALFAQAIASDCELALQITREMGGLPLALDQAGAYLKETGSSLAAYLHLYQLAHTKLLQDRRGLVADHPEPVTTTWSLSSSSGKRTRGCASRPSSSSQTGQTLCVGVGGVALPSEMWFHIMLLLLRAQVHSANHSLLQRAILE